MAGLNPIESQWQTQVMDPYFLLERPGPYFAQEQEMHSTTGEQSSEDLFSTKFNTAHKAN